MNPAQSPCPLYRPYRPHRPYRQLLLRVPIIGTAVVCFTMFVLLINTPIFAQQQTPSSEPRQTLTTRGPLQIEINRGVVRPLRFAIPRFLQATVGASLFADDIVRVISNDLINTDLFGLIPQSAYLSGIDDFNAAIAFADWQAINTEVLITGNVASAPDGTLTVSFRLFDVFSESPLGAGIEISGSNENWRRIAHKVADVIYSRITGESPYFDSQIVFVAETGSKQNKRKQIALMDYDGARVRFLTSGEFLVLAPRLSPDSQQLIYTSYQSGLPQVYLRDMQTGKTRVLFQQNTVMTFSPRFSPNQSSVVFSLNQNSNTDIYKFDFDTNQQTRLTRALSIETAPDFSPNGESIVFESNRSGTQQIYIMSARGGPAQRISFGQGQYGTPVWSPRGDLIAFTKQYQGRFHIGVMRPNGQEERLLTSSFLDEGPTWSPNGRVIMFARETAGETGVSALYSVDVSGRNLRAVKILNGEIGGSDPSWSKMPQ